MKFLSSFGLKRYLASALTALAGVLAADPHLVALLPVVSWLAGALGLVGLVHAGKEGTLLEKPQLSISSLFPLLILAAEYVPQLAPYKELLLTIGPLFGLATVVTHPLPAEKAIVKSIKASKGK
jgi:hypothetical protein